MTKDLEIQIKLQQIITRREGMIAENKQREGMNNSMAYSESFFTALEIEMESLLEKDEESLSQKLCTDCRHMSNPCDTCNNHEGWGPK